MTSICFLIQTAKLNIRSLRYFLINKSTSWFKVLEALYLRLRYATNLVTGMKAHLIGIESYGGCRPQKLSTLNNYLHENIVIQCFRQIHDA